MKLFLSIVSECDIFPSELIFDAKISFQFSIQAKKQQNNTTTMASFGQLVTVAKKQTSFT